MIAQNQKVPKLSLGKSKWVVLGLILVYSFIPVFGGLIRVLELSGGPQVAPANLRVLLAPLPITLHSFKFMMKEPRWPSIMILSCVPSLAKYIQSYEQLDKLISRVHFSTIKLKLDENLLTKLLFAFTDKLQIEIEHIVTPEFLARLDHAS